MLLFIQTPFFHISVAFRQHEMTTLGTFEHHGPRTQRANRLRGAGFWSPFLTNIVFRLHETSLFEKNEMGQVGPFRVPFVLGV